MIRICIFSSHLDPAVDAEELAGLVVDLLQVLSVPVKVGREQEVGAQVDAMSGDGNGGISTDTFHILPSRPSNTVCIFYFCYTQEAG